MPNERLKSLIEAELPALREIRHDLHRHPELCFEERYTSGLVQRELRAAGIAFKAGLGKGTGIIAHLPATDPAGAKQMAVAFRADMDALPVVEQTGLPYASLTQGLMHACGHDGHTTMLLGAAKILAKMPRPRPVTFVFQPAEEGGGGADIMCREGALAGEERGGIGTPVGEIYGLHGWPTFEVGRVATRSGPILAATDDFTISIRGTQAHGAYPHFGADPIVAAAQSIVAIQTIASRNIGPLDSVVVTVGAINAGTANNIIPEVARFIGTVRTLRASTRATAKKRFFEIVEGTAMAMGCRAEIDWHEGYPVTANDHAATEKFFRTARAVLGESRVEVVPDATMGGEDFSYYGHHVPACFFFLGLRPTGRDTYPTLHQPDFDFNDEALPTGIEMFCELAAAAPVQR